MPPASTSPLAAYVAHLQRGELGYQFSPSLGKAVFYPRVIAPVTGADDLIRLLSGERIGRTTEISIVSAGRLKSISVTPIERDRR